MSGRQKPKYAHGIYTTGQYETWVISIAAHGTYLLDTKHWLKLTIAEFKTILNEQPPLVRLDKVPYEK